MGKKLEALKKFAQKADKAMVKVGTGFQKLQVELEKTGLAEMSVADALGFEGFSGQPRRQKKKHGLNLDEFEITEVKLEKKKKHG